MGRRQGAQAPGHDTEGEAHQRGDSQHRDVSTVRLGCSSRPVRNRTLSANMSMSAGSSPAQGG